MGANWQSATAKSSPPSFTIHQNAQQSYFVNYAVKTLANKDGHFSISLSIHQNALKSYFFRTHSYETLASEDDHLLVPIKLEYTIITVLSNFYTQLASKDHLIPKYVLALYFFSQLCSSDMTLVSEVCHVLIQTINMVCNHNFLSLPNLFWRQHVLLLVMNSSVTYFDTGAEIGRNQVLYSW